MKKIISQLVVRLLQQQIRQEQRNISSGQRKSIFKLIAYAAIAVAITYVMMKGLPTWLQTEQNNQSQAFMQTVLQQNNASILPFGWPQVSDDVATRLLNNECYHVGYSDQRANPLWVVYPIRDFHDGQIAPRPKQFLLDERTSAQIVHQHYNRSGYDRGHLAPNNTIGRLCSDAGQLETFLMSNISPQTKALNQRWWERLERVEMQHFTKQFKQVFVMAGPVFDAHPVELPKGPVQVPVAFYKVFLAEKKGQWHVLAFLVEQGVEGSEPLSQYRTSLARVQQATGIEFLPTAPAELKQRLLNDTTDKSWRLDVVDLIPPIYGKSS